MNLPLNTTPTYTLNIPSTKKDFSFRPFLVREQKALLIAQESEDSDVMLKTVKDVIKNCAKTPIDVDELAMFDIEYIFLNLRAKSVGEIVELTFMCDEDHGEDNPKAKSTVQINLDQVKVVFPEGHMNNIPLFNQVGMKMKYPNLHTLHKLDKSKSTNTDMLFDTIADCIELIYDDDQIFTAKEQKKEDLMEFLFNLSAAQFEKVQQFFITMPTLKIDVQYQCPVCGKQHNKQVEGLGNFF